MDYAVFLTGLYLLIAALGCVFLFRRDLGNPRWLALLAAFVSMTLGIWLDIISFAYDLGEGIQLARALLASAAATACLGFHLMPLTEGNFPAFVRKWAALVGVFGITFISGAGDPSSLLHVIPLLAAAGLAGWKFPGCTRHLAESSRSAPPALTAFLFIAAASSCIFPQAVETTYDIHGLRFSPERLARLGLIGAGNLAALGVCLILWMRLYQRNLRRFSPDLLRRRRFGTMVILAATSLAILNGAWLAYWLGNQARKHEDTGLLSALNLGAGSLDPETVNSIEGRPEEVSSPAFNRLRSKLVEIRGALPESRFVYLLGMRHDKLVFLADSEDPSSTATFSPPGEEVEDYPDEWMEELAGNTTFSGPEPDKWGVWYSACIPVYDPSDKLIALLGTDYPARKWLMPVAARRLAAMGVTFSVALLLAAMFGSHIRAIDAARRVESLSERLSDAMTAADFDTWECFPKPFQLIVGDKIAKVLGWTGVNARPSFRKVWRTIHPDDRAQLFDLVRQKGSSDAEVRLRNADGRWVCFLLRGRIVLSSSGSETDRLVGTILDIDERHRAQLEIDRQRRFAQQVMESVPNGLAVINEAGIVSYANPAFERLAGAARRELVGRSIHLHLPDVGEAASCDQGRESALIRLDGADVPVSVFRAPLSESSSGGESILALVDLTAAKAAERALVQSRAEASRLALVAKRTDNAVVITDAQGRVEWVNEGFTKISGYQREEVLGQTPGSILQHPGFEHPMRGFMREKIREGRGFETEVLNFAKDGRPYYVHIECQPLVNKQGELTGFMAIERDITEQRRSNLLLEAVGSISTKLLSLRLDSTLWGEILASLGTAAEADRCYFFRVHPHPESGASAMSQIAEWNSGSSSPQIDNPQLQNLPFIESGFGRWFEELSAGREIVGLVRDFPSAERPILEAQEIQSLAVVPVFTGSELAGFLGFDSCQRQRVWEKWEISILRSAAANIGLRQVVQNESDALVQARDEARSAARTADRANQAKSIFLATMSHEIRTPLNAVVGMASLLETTRLDTEQREYAGTILHSSGFLLELINDILDYSRIESSGIELDSAPIPVETVCREAFDIIRPGLIGKQLELIGRVAPGLPGKFTGDPARLRQTLVNLLGNAVKFTSSGHVCLSVDGRPLPDGRWSLDFDISDSGIGISEEALPRLFSPFVQEDSSTTRRFGGSGLGLAICRSLIRAMGGEITVTSKSGEGSNFRISLSLSPVAEVSAPSHPPLLPMESKVLIVEDHPVNRAILEEILSVRGVSFHSAGDAFEAMALWRNEGPFALVIADQQLPGMDAVELHHLLRSESGSAGTRFVLGSSDNTQSQEIRSLFAEVVSKPFWTSSIHSLLDRQLFQCEAGAATTTDHQNLPTPANLTVLVGEDNPNNQRVIHLLLRHLGIEPVIASDGREAVEAAARQSFDVILLDIQMPVMDGLEACRLIRSQQHDKRPRIIALTANVFREDREAAAAAGMDDYLAKPITLERLREKLADLAAPDPIQRSRQDEVQLLEPEILRNLAALGFETFRELMDDTIESSRNHIDGLAELIRNGDAVAFGELAHKTLGGLLQFGFVALPNHIRTLRRESRIPNPENANPVRAELIQLLDQSLAALADWKSDHWRASGKPAAVGTGPRS